MLEEQIKAQQKSSAEVMKKLNEKQEALQKLQVNQQALVAQALGNHAEGTSFAEDLRRNATQSVSNAAQIGRDVLKVPVVGETIGAGLSLPFVGAGMAAATIAKIFGGGR